MKYFLEIKVLPDPEFVETVLMNALFSKLHRALVLLSSNDVGVSFPNVEKTLGNCLRLHGTREKLSQLMADNWLKTLKDFTRQTSIQPVPGNVKHRIVKRVQPQSSVERLRRRSITKGWLSEAEAVERISFNKRKTGLTLPFVRLKSLSTRQNFPLFIEHGELKDKAVQGMFNAYGLSSKATIPWF